MSKLDGVIGVQGNDEYNDGFNAGINFVKTVIESREFSNAFSDLLFADETVYADTVNQIVLKTLKEFNL
jgi:hypothetical protein